MQATVADKRAPRPSADPTRESILAAALDLFSERSFAGATTREIAAEAGVTQPLLNYHFRTKDELWQSAVAGLFARLGSTMAERRAGLRGVDDLTTARLVVREFVAFSAANPQLHRIIMQECKTDGPRMDWLVEQHVRPTYDWIVEMFDGLIRKGAIPAIAPVHLYYLLVGAAPTIFVLAPECRRLSGIDPFDPETIETHTEAVLTMLFGIDTHAGPKSQRRARR